VLKKTITYTDFNGEEVSEDFFFHLSKAELVEMEMSHEGGLEESLKKIIAAEDAKSIIAEFKNIILSAYGKKSIDGRRFIKNQQLRDEFESTEAYSVLFMELVTDTDAAINFINGVIPAGLAEEAAKVTNTTPAIAAIPDDAESNTSEPQLLPKADFMAMSAEDLEKLAPRIASGEVKIVE
jgi:hypothetical protein